MKTLSTIIPAIGISCLLLTVNCQLTYSQDMGAIALVAPTSPMCAATNQTVTVTIRNYAATTIDFSVNPTNVVVGITGPIVQSFTVTLSTGTLTATSNQNVNVTTAANFSAAGTYTVNANTVVTGDVNPANDAMSPPVTITVNTIPVVNLGPDVTQCGGTVMLNAGNPGASYLWSSGASTQTYNVTITGTYSVVVTNGCGSSSDTINVTINSNPPVNLGGNVTQCGNAFLNAGNPGASYLWSTGATVQIINVTTSGNYSVVVTNSSGCTNSDIANVTINPFPVVNLGPDVTTCSIATLNAGNPGSTYLWSTGAGTQTISVTSTGTYSVIVTDANGCSSSDTINATINSAPVVNLGPDITQCGGSVLLNAGNPGASYLWSTSATTQTLNVSSTGTYFVTVTNGCGNASDTIKVTINSVPLVNLGPDVTQCGGTVTLNAGNPGSSYLWSTGATSSIISVSSSGQYYVDVTNTNGCSAADTINITITPIPVVNLGPDTIQCGGTVLLNAGNPGSSYIWSTNATTQTIIVSSSGNYFVTVTNNCGFASDQISVTINTVPVVNLGPDVTKCGKATLDAGNPGLTYLWSTGSTTQTITALLSGQYNVKVSTANGCSASDTINVTINPLPVVNLGPDITQCGGTTLDAGNPGSTYLWSTNATTQTINVTNSGTYFVAVTDANGCSKTDTIVVTTTGQSTPLVEGFEIPNTFPPTGWTLNNPDGNITWTQTSTAFKTGGHSMYVNNFAYTASGQKDEVITSPINLSGGSAPPQLTFQVAYQLFTNPNASPNHSDTLRVQYSTDCGATWTTAYNKYGIALTTDSNAVFSITPFVPTVSQWRMETVSLPNASSVMIKFLNINGYENNLYIDDININNGVGVEELGVLSWEFEVFPNPSDDGNFTVLLNPSAGGPNTQIEVYNVMGEKVYQSRISNLKSQISLDVPNGIYLLEIHNLTDNAKAVKRIIINK